MMAKVLTITLNTAYDLIGRLPRIELGEVNSVEYLGLHPAGKGVNVAKVLKDLDVDVSLGGFLGKDNQSGFSKMLAERQFPDYFHRIDGATRINVKITETESNVTDFNFQGYQITQADWQAFVKDSLEYSKEFDIVAICGSLPRGISAEQFGQWIQTLSEQGVKVVLDSSNQALRAGLSAKPWLVKPNHRELEAWAGQKLNSLPEIINAAKKLQAQGIPNVVISMGEEGAIWLSEKAVIQAQPPKCQNVVSTVGAGDSMVAGLIYGLIHHLPQKDTLTFASAVSFLAVSQSNVGVPDPALIPPVIEQIKIKLLDS